MHYVFYQVIMSILGIIGRPRLKLGNSEVQQSRPFSDGDHSFHLGSLLSSLPFQLKPWQSVPRCQSSIVISLI